MKFKCVCCGNINVLSCSVLYWNYIDSEQTTPYHLGGVNLTKQESDLRINIIQYSSMTITFGFGSLLVFSAPEIFKESIKEK